MAIVNRILALWMLCSAGLAAEEIRCRAGELVVREGLALRVDGRAALTVNGPCRVVLRGLRVTGDRATAPQGQALPPSDRRFADHYGGNGVLLRGGTEAVIEDSEFREIAGFAVLASGLQRLEIRRCRFENSGSRNPMGRNNTTGGVLLEDGTANFVVEASEFRNILGNGVWTHSRYMEVRNGPGVIRGNRFAEIGRDAVQVGHASRVDVLDNDMERVGYPVESVDVEGGGIPVGVDTAGNVDNSRYTGNRMRDINGKCFDLDGFHHGEVSGNTCVNPPGEYAFGNFAIVMNNTNPDMQSVGIRIEGNRLEGMKFGGIFVIGSGHLIRGNVMTRLHTSRCSEPERLAGCTYLADEPDMLRVGIYFGRRAERPAVTRANRVERNEIGGWRMDRKCMAFAPGVDPKENRRDGNVCRHEGN
jgi:hypothetical protein